MSDVNEPGKPLFAGEHAAREVLIERFEAAWQSGDTPQLVEFLPDAGVSRTATLIELVHVDLEYRLKRGNEIRVELYLEEYPELAADSQVAINLIASEYAIRSRHAALDVAEFQSRFPQFSDELNSQLTSAVIQSERETVSVMSSQETFIHRQDESDGTDDPIVGCQFRDYRIVEKIGQGGMGTVYRALHERLGKTVALKVLPEALLRDRQAVERFDREMLAIGGLDHPNVVRATDAGEAGDRRYLVMEFVDGADVASLASRHKRLPVNIACEIARQAAIGLQHIHEQGLVHRDVKPSNLMLEINSNASTVKLLDLGLARLHAPAEENLGRPLTQTGQLIGTFDYMAPEQTMAADVDIRADIYGLGSTLYRLLAGRAPFAGEEFKTPGRKIVALAQEEPTPVREFRDDVPVELAAVLDRMLAKEPEDRFQTPGEAATALMPYCENAELSRLVDGDSGLVLPAPVESLDRTVPWQQTSAKTYRRKLQRIAIAVMLALFVGAVAIIQFITAEGEWRLTTLDPGQEVMIRNGGEVVEQLTVTSRNDVLTARFGEYEAIVKDADGITVMAGTVEFLRGEEAVARLEYVGPPQDAHGNNSESIDSHAEDASVSRPRFALEFDDVHDFVHIRSLHSDSGPLTVELFLRRDVAEDSIIFGMWGDRESLLKHAGFHNIGFYVEDEDGESWHLARGSAWRMRNGHFVHVAGVFDGRESAVFINGKKLGYRRPGESRKWISGQFAQIGQEGKSFRGAVREIHVSSVARYQESFIPPKQRFEPDEHTLALYHCDEGQGEILKDSSGNRYDGRIHGASWIRLDDDAPSPEPQDTFDWADHLPTDAPEPAKAPFNTDEAKGHQIAWAEHLGLPVERDIQLPGEQSLKMVLIPPGEFLMGTSDEDQVTLLHYTESRSDEFESKCIVSEGPAHVVRITRPFYLGKYEVTQAQWNAITGEERAFHKVGPSHPADALSWDDVPPLLSRLNEISIDSGLTFVMPTEAQWEYACRAGSTGLWHFGDTSEGLEQYAWYLGNSELTSHPVGQLLPNAWALHDMYGNLQEWCADRTELEYYVDASSVDPTGLAEGEERVRRGGAASLHEQWSRSASRVWAGQSGRGLSFGFRMAATISSELLPKN